MLKIGLTGGIGSGKSTIAQAFSALGVPVFNADEETKKHLDDPEVQPELVKIFGWEAVDTHGKTDRKAIARIAFNDQDKLNRLNALMHPIAAKAFNAWLSRIDAAPYIIKEAAILFESGAYKSVDKVITVSCPQEIRLQRVMSRDGVGEAQVLDRMRKQWTDAEREKHAQYVILNSDTPILAEVLRLHELFLRESKA